MEALRTVEADVNPTIFAVRNTELRLSTRRSKIRVDSLSSVLH